jgi:membrane protease YdiL (CAAX protease family)
MSYRAQPAPEYHRSAVSSPGRRGELVTFLVLVVAATIAVAATFPRSSIAPLASAFVPVAVLIVLTPIQGRSVWTGLGLTRVGVWLWPVAVAVPIAVAATSYLVISRLGMGNPIALSDLSGFSILINISVAIVLVLGEELGWRGYLLPRVQQLTTRPAGAILTAVAHAAAHLPLILLTSTYNSVGSRSVVAPLTDVTISGAGSFYAWLRDAALSIWPAALAHAVGNTAVAFVSAAALPSAAISLAYLAGEGGLVTALATTAVAATVLIHARRNAWRSAAPPGPR